MKILTATSKELQISRLPNYEHSSFETKNANDSPESLINVENSFLILVCVELGDDTEVVKKMSHRVINQWEKHKTEFNNIILVPFGHLSEITQPSLSKVQLVIDKLFRVLKNQGIIIHKVEPDNANYLFSKILIFDSGISVRFGSSSNGLKALLDDILAIYGPKQLLSALSEKLFYKRGDN